MGVVKSDLVQLKEKELSTLSPEQKTFNRLRRKVEALQKKEEARLQELDKALQFYYGHIFPLEKELVHWLMERVRIMYQFSQDKKGWFRSKRDILKELILDDFHDALQILPSEYLPEDVMQIFKEVSGVSYEQVVQEEMMQAKSEMQEMFQEMGMDVDLSEIEGSDREEEVMQKLFEALDAANTEKSDHPSAKKKTKKQLIKEQQAAEMQKKSLNSIYRQLAKAFHPDLEPDSEKKREKEGLMRQLTVAYAKEDLHTLLMLELKWINGLDDEALSRSTEQLKIYNAILKNQAETLQVQIDVLWDIPKYCPLQRFYTDSFEGISVLKQVHAELFLEEQRFGRIVGLLKGIEGRSILRQTINDKMSGY